MTRAPATPISALDGAPPRRPQRRCDRPSRSSVEAACRCPRGAFRSCPTGLWRYVTTQRSRRQVSEDQLRLGEQLGTVARHRPGQRASRVLVRLGREPGKQVCRGDFGRPRIDRLVDLIPVDGLPDPMSEDDPAWAGRPIPACNGVRSALARTRVSLGLRSGMLGRSF